MSNAMILVVDDERVVCQSCQRLLVAEGYQVHACQDPQRAMGLVEQNLYDAVLVDLRMPELNGMEFLRRAKSVRPEVEVVIMTGFSEIATAVEAIKLGAFDYLPKPFSPDQLFVTVARAIENRNILEENRYLRSQLQSRYEFKNIIGSSAGMRRAFELIARVSPTTASVIIRGESGTGKELVARAIHFNSARKTASFVAVDCGALHESLLESELFGHVEGAFTGAVAARKGFFAAAEGGTLFLDEIGNTSLALQTRLLRVLQQRVYTPVGDTVERPTDVRLITATNRDLEQMVVDGTFREELFYRLNIVCIPLPPLRERREDIPPLFQHFLAKYRKEVGRPTIHVAADTLHLLVEYDWPGNVRELENVVQRAVVLSEDDELNPESLPSALRRPAGGAFETVPQTSAELKARKKRLRLQAVETVERAFVTDALERNHWNVTHAAQDVGMHRPNFQALMRKHQIQTPSTP